MFAISLPFSLFWASFVITNAIPFLSLANSLDKAGQSVQRNLDSAIHSIFLIRPDLWFRYTVFGDSNNLDSQYLTNYWTISISTNETIVNNGDCNLFEKFLCSSSNCYEDTSSLYSQDFLTFSTENATRLHLTPQTISIADGAWQINSPTLYLHTCRALETVYSNSVSGQIGLGLGGSAYKNFQTTRPIFSIILHTRFTIELIFGFNSTYANDFATAIFLSCDLNWNIKVSSMAIDTSKLVENPVTLVFDIDTPFISLPLSYYSSLKTYFFQVLGFKSCSEEPPSNSFYCLYEGEINDLPTLEFNLENGAQFLLAPEAYVIEWGSIYEARFALYDSKLSGVDYIILGRTVMFHYYTAFELINQTPKITLYPATHISTTSGYQLQIKSSPLEIYSESSNLNQSNSSLNSTLDMTSSSSQSENDFTSTDTTSEPQSSYDPRITQTENTFENQNDITGDYTLDAILIIMLILLISVVVVYLCLKGQRITHDKMIKAHKPNLELNRSSYFVSSNNNTLGGNETPTFE